MATSWQHKQFLENYNMGDMTQVLHRYGTGTTAQMKCLCRTGVVPADVGTVPSHINCSALFSSHFH